MRNVAIFDIDNCLADDGWRVRHIDWTERDPTRRYAHYHSLSISDEAVNLDVFQQYREYCEIAIFTSRPTIHFTITEEWLKRKEIKYEHLLMRNNNDFRNSRIVKETQLQWLTGGEYNGVTKMDIIQAFDDRMDVVQMYWTHGIAARQLLIHEPRIYFNPANGRHDDSEPTNSDHL